MQMPFRRDGLTAPIITVPASPPVTERMPWMKSRAVSARKSPSLMGSERKDSFAQITQLPSSLIFYRLTSNATVIRGASPKYFGTKCHV